MGDAFTWAELHFQQFMDLVHGMTGNIEVLGICKIIVQLIIINASSTDSRRNPQSEGLVHEDLCGSRRCQVD